MTNVRWQNYTPDGEHDMQGAGFAADSVRTIQAVRRESPNVQILLFSATFDDTVKRFAMKVVPGANQVGGVCCKCAATCLNLRNPVGRADIVSGRRSLCQKRSCHWMS
jgi:hypothetical protein